jgi:hypothetical protein
MGKAMPTNSEAEDRAIEELDVSALFGLNLFESLWYRLMKVFLYRREERFARRVLELMNNTLPLTDFGRGILLGMLDAWDMSGDMSPHMHILLQTRIQDSRYHRAKDLPAPAEPSPV